MMIGAYNKCFTQKEENNAKVAKQRDNKGEAPFKFWIKENVILLRIKMDDKDNKGMDDVAQVNNRSKIKEHL